MSVHLLCVHVPLFRLALARRDVTGTACGEATVLADKADRGRVIEVDAKAHALGARIGHTVLQARAAAGGVHVLVHDAQRSAAVWSDMLDALDALSPLVDDAGEGTAYLDMRGIEGDAAQWTRHAHDALRGFELPLHCAVADNKFIALALTYAPDGNTGALPVEVLAVDTKTADRLHLLGVHTLGDVAALPHGPFVRRFGKAAAQWHDRARGIDPTPFRPRAHELHIDAAAYGEGSADQAEQVLFALRVLAERVCNDLQRAGRAAGIVHLTFECENGDVHELDAGFSEPAADARIILDVVRVKLEGLQFNAPVSGLRMQVVRLEDRGAPATLFAQNEPDPQAVALALARLQAVTGAVPHCARTRRATCLEERFVYDPFVPRPAAAAQRSPSTTAMAPQMRLLVVREIGVNVRGNTPVRVCLHEGHYYQRVVECAGPWRVDDGWFDTPIERDEYDVLLEDGMLCRIYRQGTHWYLRGAYD